eukprot:9682_1
MSTVLLLENMASLQHHILVLYITMFCCIGQNITSSTIAVLDPMPSNMYTTSSSPSNNKSLWTQWSKYQMNGWNLMFLIICALLLLCTFCCVFGYFCCQHLSRRRMYKKQIQQNEKKHNSMDLREEDNEKDITIAMNTAESNTITSTKSNPNNDIFPDNIKDRQAIYAEHNLGIGSPKHYNNNDNQWNSNPNHPSDINRNSLQSPKNDNRGRDERSSSIQRHKSPSNPRNKSPNHIASSPNREQDRNGRYSHRTHKISEVQSDPHTHTHSSKKNRSKSLKKQDPNDTTHKHMPSNLAVEMEMAQVHMGMNMNNQRSSDNSGSTMTSDDTDNDEKSNLVDDKRRSNRSRNEIDSKGNPRSMRSFSRRSASVEKYNNKRIYDDMREDPELAQYTQHQNNNHNGSQAPKDTHNAYRQVNHHKDTYDEDSDSDTTSSSDDSTDFDDTDTTSSSNEGTSNEDTSEEEDSEEESQDGQGHDTTTSDFVGNFGIHMFENDANNMKPNAKNKMNKKSAKKSPKKSPRKTPRKTPRKSPKKQRDYDGNNKKIIDPNDAEEDELDDDDVLSPLKVVKARKQVKKHHVADNSNTLESMDDDNEVEVALEEDIDRDFQD